MDELMENLHFLRWYTKQEKRSPVALNLMESIIEAMVERGLEELTFFHFQDILVKKLFDAAAEIEGSSGRPDSESAFAPLKELVAFHRQYTLTQIHRNKSPDDTERFNSYRSLFKIHTSLHEFDSKAIDHDTVLPNRHILVIGISAEPEYITKDYSGVILHEPFTVQQVRQALVKAGTPVDDAIKLQVLIIGDGTPAIKTLVSVIKADTTVRNEVIVAKNGIEAIALIATRDIDFLLTDLEAPVMTGRDNLKVVKDHQTHLISRRMNSSSIVKKTPQDRIMSGGTSEAPTYLPRIPSVKDDLRIARAATAHAKGRVRRIPHVYQEEIKLMPPQSPTLRALLAQSSQGKRLVHSIK